MKKNSFILLLSIFCCVIVLVIASILFSQHSMEITVRTETGQDIQLYSNSYALVVGNGNYTNGWNRLDGALKDVKEVAAALEKHNFNVTLKTDLNKAEFEAAFETLIKSVEGDENSRLLFYFAGHGHTEKLRTDEELGYLVMVDSPAPTTIGEIDGSKNIDMETMITQAKRIDALHVLYVFDSCFSGSIFNVRSTLIPTAIQDSIKYPVRQFITAGRANQEVPDRSRFKTAFLDLLAGRAVEPYPDGYITGEELGFYLKNEVPNRYPAQNPQYAKINDPNLNKGDFIFVIPQRKIKWTGTLTVANTWSIGVEPVPPIKQVTILSLQSNPSGVNVYINNVQVGKTPLTDRKIDAFGANKEPIIVHLEHEGYNSEEIVIESHTDIANLKVFLGNSSDVSGRGVPEPYVQRQIVEPDGAKMVLIPAGEFEMGGNIDFESLDSVWIQEGFDIASIPVHTVSLDAFYMDVYEVTNAQYKKFVNANPEWQKANIEPEYHDGDYLKNWNGNNYPDGKDDHPVVFVSWYAAVAYAKSVGKRLPTEAEWEYAARGGLVEKKYPWGDSITPLHANYERNMDDTNIVGYFHANEYGLYDMAGNVSEWCLDKYVPYKNSPRQNPLGGENSMDQLLSYYMSIQSDRVCRGGSWDNLTYFLQCAARVSNNPSFTQKALGFRCARSVSE